MESQADSQGPQVSQMPNSHERKHPVFPKQVFNKQQHMQISQTSLPAYGSPASSYSPFSATNAASSTSLRPQSHPNMAVNHLGPTPRVMNMANMPKFDRPHPLSDPKKLPVGSLTHMNNNIQLQQNHVKQEPSDQSNEQHKVQLSSSHGLSSFSSPTVNLKDESFEMQQSRAGFTPPTSLGPVISASNPVPSPMETNILVFDDSLISCCALLMLGQNRFTRSPFLSICTNMDEKLDSMSVNCDVSGISHEITNSICSYNVT